LVVKGPHSNIKEEQFFDAIDSTLDTLEQEEERVFIFKAKKVVGRHV
jgi:hypothetical protein